MPELFGLYGNNLPAIKYAGNKYNLLYAEIVKDEPVWDYIVHESIITGHRSVTMRGCHWVVELKIHTYKYANLDDTHDYNDFLQNLLYNDTSFTYYRHSNGVEFVDASANVVNFKLVEFEPIEMESNDYKDALYVKFISLDFVKVMPTQT